MNPDLFFPAIDGPQIDSQRVQYHFFSISAAPSSTTIFCQSDGCAWLFCGVAIFLFTQLEKGRRIIMVVNSTLLLQRHLEGKTRHCFFLFHCNLMILWTLPTLYHLLYCITIDFANGEGSNRKTRVIITPVPDQRERTLGLGPPLMFRVCVCVCVCVTQFRFM